MKRGAGAMLTTALGLWLWIACGGRSLEGSLPGSGDTTSSGGAPGTFTTTSVVSTATTVTTTPAVTTTGAVAVTTVGSTSASTPTVTIGSTTTSVATTTMGAGGTTMVELPPYLLLGAPLSFAPTETGFGVSAVLSQGDPRDLILEVLNPATGNLAFYDSLTALAAEDTAQWQVDNLEAGQRYPYRILAPQFDDGSGDKVAIYDGSAVTQRPEGQAFSFLLFTDTHIPPRALEPGDTSLISYPETTLWDIAGGITPGEADFMVNLGDMLDFHDFGFNEPPPDGSYTRQGYLNYRRLLGDLLGHTPHFAVIGNWDGENGDFTDEEIAFSREQRLAYVPGPEPETYPEGGNLYEDYYAFTWGDALFVVLNVMTYTPTSHLLSYGPGVADDWTLGDEQMEFLATTLSGATSKWRFLLIHHAVGGAAGDDMNSAYGRGGGQAANVGEQAIVHQLMQDYGVQIFFYGHDHVFTDMVVDGIHYTLPGSAGAQWKFEGNETGYTEYWRDSGHGRVEVSPSSVSVDFVNWEGNVIFNYVLDE